MTLDDYGLADRHPVRYQRGAGHRWRNGLAVGVNDDGSIDVVDDYSSNVRALHPDRVVIEAKRRGPRGGVRWEPVSRREEPA